MVVAYASVADAIKKFPEFEDRVQCFWLAGASVSERVRKGEVDAICKFQFAGVVEVPMPIDPAPVIIRRAVVEASDFP